jgi:hypothetical protein
MINSVDESLWPPVHANINLGTFDEKTRQFENTPYFVLDEAPEVAKVYGDRPTSLEIMFYHREVEKSARAQLELWSGGAYDSEGNRIGGKPRCFGNGPYTDGRPGRAEWFDLKELPPEESIAWVRDPKTGIVPRVCYGENCVHWQDAKGKPMCKQTMTLIFTIPLVSLDDLYRITTHSWTSIRDFQSLLQTNASIGGIVGVPFRIFKEDRTKTHTDKITGKVYKRAMPILGIGKSLDFFEKHGGVLQDKANKLMERKNYLKAYTSEDAVYLSRSGLDMEALPEAIPLTPAERAKELLTDPDVMAAFVRLEDAVGKKFNDKARSQAILKKENEPDMKAAVLESIEQKVLEAAERNKPVAVEVVVEPVAEVVVPSADQVMDAMDPLPAS